MTSTTPFGPLISICLAGMMLVGCSGGMGRSKTPIEIGPHRGTLSSPAGWTFVNQGEKWELRKGEASIVLHDLGPASPAAIQNEATQIAALWRSGNPAGAQTRLKRLAGQARNFVAAPGLTPLMSALLPLLEAAALSLPEPELAGRLSDLDAAIAALPAPDLDVQAEAALRIAGHDQRRDIQSRERVTVGGKPALNFMTVTKSTQTYKKRIVVIDNDGHLLAIYFGILGHEAHLGEFDQVVRTLHLGAAASARR